MKTLGDLKTRIITETTRDDLADDLAAAFNLVIAASIAYWENERFWFTEQRATVFTVAGNRSVTVPAEFSFVDDLQAVIGGQPQRLRKRSLQWMQDMQTAGNTGQPSDWTWFRNAVEIWPVPNVAYQLVLWGVAAVDPPLDYANENSGNDWTNAGQDLITATTKKRLYRDYLSATETDPRVMLARNQEDEAYSRLKSESNRRLATGRIEPAW